MFITKMALPRRTFLRGMGAVIALPLLDAMVPAAVGAASAAAPVKRLGFVYTPNGATMASWTPSSEGPLLTELSPTLSPLAALRIRCWCHWSQSAPGGVAGRWEWRAFPRTNGVAVGPSEAHRGRTSRPERPLIRSRPRCRQDTPLCRSRCVGAELSRRQLR
jgi:hypothetical protein